MGLAPASAIYQIAVFGVSCGLHDQFHARKAALAWMCPTLVDRPEVIWEISGRGKFT